LLLARLRQIGGEPPASSGEARAAWQAVLAGGASREELLGRLRGRSAAP
jgi:hypothetical protein